MRTCLPPSNITQVNFQGSLIATGTCIAGLNLTHLNFCHSSGYKNAELKNKCSDLVVKARMLSNYQAELVPCRFFLATEWN